jgi:hypothetical protein
MRDAVLSALTRYSRVVGIFLCVPSNAFSAAEIAASTEIVGVEDANAARKPVSNSAEDYLRILTRLGERIAK